MVSTSAGLREPLLVILGTTGTGKSDLAVELAKRFRGEVINADAMQMYNGLPISTNKITAEEQQGVAHHLLDMIELNEDTWTVHRYQREARRIIREIRSRGNVPIVVGGTHYYTNAVLFDDTLEDPVDDEGQAADATSAEFPILNGPTEAMLEKLREVDPVMADRWHPNDRRKIRRSLEIFLQRGVRASDLYAAQRQRKADEARVVVGDGLASSDGERALLFWVHSQREALCRRLDGRVDTMSSRGLVDEAQHMFNFLRQKEAAAGPAVDRSVGIWQSIGFKELEPYLAALAEGAASELELASLKAQGLERVKAATRQYAKAQMRWIKYKTVNLVRERGAMSHLFVLDSTDVGAWREAVVEPAVDIATRFLEGRQLPDPLSVSDAAASVLEPLLSDEAQAHRQFKRYHCDLCNMTFTIQGDWERHIASYRHRRRDQKRRAREAGAASSGRPGNEGTAEDSASEADALDDRLGLFDKPYEPAAVK